MSSDVFHTYEEFNGKYSFCKAVYYNMTCSATRNVIVKRRVKVCHLEEVNFYLLLMVWWRVCYFWIGRRQLVVMTQLQLWRSCRDMPKSSENLFGTAAMLISGSLCKTDRGKQDIKVQVARRKHLQFFSASFSLMLLCDHNDLSLCLPLPVGNVPSRWHTYSLILGVY